MKEQEIIDYCLDSLARQGAEKSQVVLKKTEKQEMNVDSGELSLFRTTYDNELDLTAIRDNKKGNCSVNKTDEDEIEEAVDRTFEILETSSEDEAYDIAPKQKPQEFISGPQEPDLDRMYELLNGFLEKMQDRYPRINLIQTILDYQRTTKRFVNSNGVDFASQKGVYHVFMFFSSKDEEKTSSFDAVQLSLAELEKDLFDFQVVEDGLESSLDHLEARPLGAKFTGDVIITPQALQMFLMMFGRVFLGNQALISGTSRLEDELGEQVTSPKFTLHSKPVSEEICDGYFVTPDGFAAENVALLEDGVLKSFLLDQYGANKTGKERAKTAGGAYVMEPGSKPLGDLVDDVERGLLVARYSGGMPNSNGDFSGVAKNSFYIEDGQVKHPVTETMIAGNLLDLLVNINDISEERIDFGSAILPWISSHGVTISGK